MQTNLVGHIVTRTKPIALDHAMAFTASDSWKASIKDRLKHPNDRYKIVAVAHGTTTGWQIIAQNLRTLVVDSVFLSELIFETEVAPVKQ